MKVVISGGGTGGHLFPAVALGEEMVRERPDTDVLYVGTAAGFEARWLPASGYRYELFQVQGLRGRGLGARIVSLGKFVRAVALARAVLARTRPEVVVCAGGYASAPVGVAAVMARIPLVLMEQNTRPGLSNRMLWRFARKICVGFAETASYFSASKVAVTGNPVRFAFDPSPRPQLEGPLQILVLGGSSGAHRLNIGVLEAFKICGNRVINLAVVHQTGEADEELVRAGYRDLSLKAEAVPFITDISGALAAADMVIARAGAMAVTEIALAARPAIFVPYPFHKDRQQEHNARVIAKLGGASIIKDDDELPQNLARELERLSSAPDLLRDMGRNAHRAARPDAARAIAHICFDLAGRERVAA